MRYSEEQKQGYEDKLDEIRLELPKFLESYFDYLDTRGLAIRTKLGYAQDLLIFFQYFITRIEKFNYIPMHELPVEFLSEIDVDMLNKYLKEIRSYVVRDSEIYYVRPNSSKDKEKYTKEGVGKLKTNSDAAICRKISSLKTMFNYYFITEKIARNPMVHIQSPDVNDKAIVILDGQQTKQLMQNIDAHKTADDTKRHKAHLEHYSARDYAICSVLLGTGVRVSELVGMDLDDVDFHRNRIRIIRKGGDEEYVYFNEEVAEALLFYLDTRKNITPVAGYEGALFLSSQRKRLCVRSVQNLVYKYCDAVMGNKDIHVHTLRKTYGSRIYVQTGGDLLVTAKVLGHKSVKTTQKAYAFLDEERVKSAVVHSSMFDENDNSAKK